MHSCASLWELMRMLYGAHGYQSEPIMEITDERQQEAFIHILDELLWFGNEPQHEKINQNQLSYNNVIRQDNPECKQSNDMTIIMSVEGTFVFLRFFVF